MKLTNAEIYNAKVPIQKLMVVKLPVLTSLKLVKLSKALKEHLDIIEKVRDDLIRYYGETAPNIPGGAQISPAMEGFPKYAEELGQLMDQEVEVDFEVVKIPTNIELEPYVILALEKFVELEEVVSVSQIIDLKNK